LLISEKPFKGVTLKAIESPSSRMTTIQTVEKKDEESCDGICFYEWYIHCLLLRHREKSNWTFLIMIEMKLQEFRIHIITMVLGVSLLAAGIATTSAYGLVKITSPAKGQQVPVGKRLTR